MINILTGTRLLFYEFNMLQNCLENLPSKSNISRSNNFKAGDHTPRSWMPPIETTLKCHPSWKFQSDLHVRAAFRKQILSSNCAQPCVCLIALFPNSKRKAECDNSHHLAFKGPSDPFA